MSSHDRNKRRTKMPRSVLRAQQELRQSAVPVLDLRDKRPTQLLRSFGVVRRLVSVSSAIPAEHPLHAIAHEANEQEIAYTANVSIVPGYIAIKLARATSMSADEIQEKFECVAETLPTNLTVELGALSHFGAAIDSPGRKYVGYGFNAKGTTLLHGEQKYVLAQVGFHPPNHLSSHINIADSHDANLMRRTLYELKQFDVQNLPITLGPPEVIPVQAQVTQPASFGQK